MASGYQLMANESIILQANNVGRDGAMLQTDDLVLTNHRLICVSKGVFGNVKDTFDYPLNQIKMINDQPQVFIGSHRGGHPVLEIHMITGVIEKFLFQSPTKKNVEKWVDSISGLILGEDIEIGKDTVVGSLHGSIKDIQEQIREMTGMAGGVSGLKDMFFGKAKNDSTNSVNKSPKKITRKCISCHAPLNGYEGKSVKCKYCDTEQSL